MATAGSAGFDGFRVAPELLDAVPPILSGIGDGIRTARGLTSTAGAAATGHPELTQAVVQFGEILTELLERSATSNELDRQRIGAVRRTYDDVERTNTQCMAGPYRGLGELLGRSPAGSVLAGPASRLSVVSPVAGSADRVQRLLGRSE
jgi:hypothetical protein